MTIAPHDAAWFGAARARAWATILLALSVLTAATLLVTTNGGTAPDLWGRPLGTDFTSFWAAASLALTGHAPAAWDPVVHAAAQHGQFPAAAGYAQDTYAFFYPPPFLLLLLPLGLLPYAPATLVWIAFTAAAYVASLRPLLPRTWPKLLPALASPAVLLNAEHGQTGALCTALLATAATQLDRQPRLAGTCLGLLCLKPQLACLVIPAMFAARRWQALASAATTACLLCLATLPILGPGAWAAFLDNTSYAATVLIDGLVGDAKMVSPFAAARLLHASLPVAWIVQVLATTVALACVLAVARRRPGGRAEIATLATAACLATPFLLDYDLTILAIPLAWTATVAIRNSDLTRDLPVLIAAFTLPLLARPLALQVGLPLAPLLIAGLLATIVRRVRRTGA